MKIKINAHTLSMSDLRALSCGEVILHGLCEAPSFRCICTDSREADAETLFVAIRGERTDGHGYMRRAAEQGCVCFLCDHLPENMRVEDAPPFAAWVVPDVIGALSRLAAAHMAHTARLAHAIAVTGSVGKTTTKECVSAVLAPAFRLFRKEGNYNSTIGLPLSVMEITGDCDAAVLEMGMSARGEIRTMSNIVRPDVAVITNIGVSHLEMLGTRENIASAKLEVAEGLRMGGTLLIPAGEPLLEERIQTLVRPDVRVLRFSLTDPSADFYAGTDGIRADSAAGGMHFDLCLPDGEWKDLFIPALGQHSVLTATVGAAVGYLLGLDEAQVRVGLLAYRPAAMRQNTVRVGQVTLLEDCYNAAPDSMRAALNVLELVSRGGRRVAVLGDMKELGNDTVHMHRMLGADCARQGVHMLITVGVLGAQIAAGARAAGMDEASVLALNTGDGEFLTADEIAEQIFSRIAAGDTVLFKASRSMEFEKICASLIQRLHGAEPGGRAEDPAP